MDQTIFENTLTINQKSELQFLQSEKLESHFKQFDIDHLIVNIDHVEIYLKEAILKIKKITINNTTFLFDMTGASNLEHIEMKKIQRFNSYYDLGNPSTKRLPDILLPKNLKFLHLRGEALYFNNFNVFLPESLEILELLNYKGFIPDISSGLKTLIIDYKYNSMISDLHNLERLILLNSSYSNFDKFNFEKLKELWIGDDCQYEFKTNQIPKNCTLFVSTRYLKNLPSDIKKFGIYYSSHPNQISYINDYINNLVSDRQYVIEDKVYALSHGHDKIVDEGVYNPSNSPYYQFVEIIN